MTDQNNSNGSSSNGGADQTQNAGQAAGGSSEQQAAARPDYFPAEYWADGKGPDLERLAKDFGELRTFKAQEDIRRQGIPEKPDAYKVELPTTFKAPEGVEVEIKPDDPLIPKVREFAHKAGFDQGQFSEALGLIAEMRAAEAAQNIENYKAEVQKLGTKGPQRIDAIKTWIRGATGKKEPLLEHVLFKAELVEELENIVRRASAGGFKQTGRENGADNAKEQFEALPPHQRTGRQGFAQVRALKQAAS